MKKLLILAPIFAASQMFAGLSASIGYGVLFPLSSKSNLATVHLGESFENNNTVTEGEAEDNIVADNTSSTLEMQLKNTNYFDIALSETNSGLGILYSATVKDTKFSPTADTTLKNMDTFTWKYQAMFLNYKHNMGSDLNVNLAVGSAKQTLANATGIAGIGDVAVTQRDLAARVDLGYSYALSKAARINMAVGYHYFKDFTKVLNTGTTNGDLQTGFAESTNVDTSNDYLNTATPAIKPSGLAASVAVVIDL